MPKYSNPVIQVSPSFICLSMMRKEWLREVRRIIQGNRQKWQNTDWNTGLPDSRAHVLNHHAVPHPTLNHHVFHTGFCQSPLAVKHKILKWDVMCMGTGAIQRLISSLNSWTSILGGQPQELPDTGWNRAQGSSGWVSMGEEKKNVSQTGATRFLLVWALARRKLLLITLKLWFSVGGDFAPPP